jgi:hypothetical protein
VVDSKQLDVLKRLTVLLEGINPTNTDLAQGAPYTHDLRGKVFRGETDFGEDTQPPMVTIIEPPQQEDGLGAGMFEIERADPWKLLLHGFVPRATPHICDLAYEMKAVVEQRLSRIIELDAKGDPKYPSDYLLGRSIISLTIHAGVTRGPIQNISAWSFFYLPMSVKLKTNPTNPYVE